MATLRKHGLKYYARIQWRDENQIVREKTVPLGTNIKSEALVRKSEVEDYEDDIKKGEDYTVEFKWLKPKGGKTKIVRRTLQETIDEYHNFKKVSGIRSSTINRSEYSLRTLTDVVGCSLPVAKLKESHITDWKEEWQYKHSPNTRQLNLNKIKAFLNYCYRKEYIKSKIFIERINGTEQDVEYIKESDLEKLFSPHPEINPYFQRAFRFYVTTGCRLGEPLKNEIDGNWLVVKSDNAKGKSKREVELSPSNLSILNEMKLRFDEQTSDEVGYNPKSVIDRHSKEFNKACKLLGIEDRHFHNLRDTYAVTRWAVTGDLYLVSKEIGHASVKQTEKYANFNIRRIMDDFPSLKKIIKERLNRAKISTGFAHLLNEENEPKSGLKVQDLKVIEVARST